MPPNFDDLTPLLQVFDMQRSIAFYRDILGFQIVSTSSPGTDFYWALLKRGNSTLMLNTAYDEGERPDSPDPLRVASHSDTILYFRCENVDEVSRYLAERGRTCGEPFNTHYGMRQVYINDPDGFELCFQHPVAG